jgi:hypothetical protein
MAVMPASSVHSVTASPDGPTDADAITPRPWGACSCAC